MTHEIIKGQEKRTQYRVRKLSGKNKTGDPNGVKAKHDRFLALLRYQYGYANDVAVVELKRLLKQFYVTNKSLGIHRARPNLEQLPDEDLD